MASVVIGAAAQAFLIALATADDDVAEVVGANLQIVPRQSHRLPTGARGC
jgi:hypothetical protein